MAIVMLVSEPAGIRIRARSASRATERLVGLIAQPLPTAGSGLWIEPCRSVHTFGVRGPLDLVFVSRSGRVLRVCECVPPRTARAAWDARAVLELRAGETRRLGLRPGMHLHWSNETEGGKR